MLDFIRNHLAHVAPIFLAGAFALAIVLERIRALYVVYPLQNEISFFEKLRDLVMKGEVAEAIAFCDRYHSKPVARVVKKALLRAHQPESLIENGLELAVEEESQKIQKRTGFLAMIANVATLLGLLGTIAGLVESFRAIGLEEGGAKTTALAEGISQAMHATMLGLGVAIPCMIAFSFLINKTTRLVSEVESSAVRVLDIIKQRYFETEAAALNKNYREQSGKGRGVA
ncbi:MAG: MotA/TolQ/ExbB proton channel family protein [Bacteriovoracia bacterium]